MKRKVLRKLGRGGWENPFPEKNDEAEAHHLTDDEAEPDRAGPLFGTSMPLFGGGWFARKRRRIPSIARKKMGLPSVLTKIPSIAKIRTPISRFLTSYVKDSIKTMSTAAVPKRRSNGSNRTNETVILSITIVVMLLIEIMMRSLEGIIMLPEDSGPFVPDRVSLMAPPDSTYDALMQPHLAHPIPHPTPHPSLMKAHPSLHPTLSTSATLSTAFLPFVSAQINAEYFDFNDGDSPNCDQSPTEMFQGRVPHISRYEQNFKTNEDYG